MQRKIVYAGAMVGSFATATKTLAELAELEIPDKQVERLTKRIGQERAAERQAELEAYEGLPLVEKGRSPREQIPEVVAVGFDGGRYQRRADEDERSDDETDDESRENSSHWREFKAGCLMTLASEAHAQDPCPDIPAAFVDPGRVDKLAKEIHGCRTPDKAGTFGDESTSTEVDETRERHAADEDPPQEKSSARRPGAPEVLVRSVVASGVSSTVFGLMLAAAAWARGFAAAKRKAFLGDGAACIWTVWRKRFSDYTPIVDFIHLLSYVYAAAMAQRSFDDGWPVYVDWIRRVWAGDSASVLEDLRRRGEELGPTERGDPDGSPRKVVAEAISYLTNNLSRTRYPEYRRDGLPITSAHLESTVKMINQRVKGTEKFWSRPGAEAILQLRADYLSDTDPMNDFWERRQAKATGANRYSCAT